MRVKAPFGNWLARRRAEAAGWVTGCICSFDLDPPRARRIGALGCPVHDGAVVSAEAIVAAEDHPQEAAPLSAVVGSREGREGNKGAKGGDALDKAPACAGATWIDPLIIPLTKSEKAPACAGATGSLCPIEECLSGVFSGCKARFAPFAPSRASRETDIPESQNHATARLLGVLADGLDMQAAAIRQLARGLM